MFLLEAGVGVFLLEVGELLVVKVVKEIFMLAAMQVMFHLLPKFEGYGEGEFEEFWQG